MKHFQRLMCAFCALAALLCGLTALVPEANAQVASGALVGTVTDASGAIVPDAEVTATNAATQQRRTVQTNAQGFYAIEPLLAASYDLIVKKTGFQVFAAHDVRVDAGLRVQINAVLQVGTEATEVTVQGETLSVETAASESGGVIGSKQIENFALNGRNFQMLAMLIPGVNNVNGAQELGGGGLTQNNPISVNGVGTEFTNFLQDGTFNMNTGCQCGLDVTAPIETISEFRMVKDNFSAKYPLSGSSNIMVETKSGTNSLHGVAYEYLRNDVLDARNFFDGSQKTPLRQNIFGFEAAGPIRKNKTFFMGSEDFRRRGTGDTLRGAFPDAAIRSGDFAGSPTLGTGGLKLDSTAQALEAQLHPGVQCVLSPTQLNPACFDPAAVALMNKFWPLPNNPSGGFLNYLNNGIESLPQRDDTYRIDQYFSERFTLMGRVSYETAKDTPPSETWNGLVGPDIGQSIKTTGLNALVRFTANINPRTINQITIAESYDKPRLSAVNAALPSGVDLTRPFTDQNPLVPTINISGGWQGLGIYSLPVTASDGEGTLTDDFTHIKGSHVLQAGVLVIFGIKRQNFYSNTHGSYSFTGVHTNDPMADYLLGLDATFYQASAQREGYYHYRQVEGYFQDDWKVSKRVTLNLGLREVWYSPDTVSNLPWSDFDPSTYSLANAPVVLPTGNFLTNSAGVPLNSAGQPVPNYLTNGIAVAGQNGVPSGVYKARTWNLGPRVGFAWDVFGDGKTSLRGGFGIGYSRIPFANYASLNNPPFVQSLNLINGTLSNAELGSAAAPISGSNLNFIGGPDYNYKPTQLDTWSLTIEREIIPRGVLSVAYVGSAAHDIDGSFDYNFPLPVSAPSVNNPACLQPGQTIPAGGFQFDPCLNAGIVSPDYTRYYKGWSAINTGGADGYGYEGNSNYNSLQVGWKYNTNHFTWTVAYTFSKALSDVAGRGFMSSGQTGSGAQNPRDFAAEYGPVGFDRTNIFTSGYIYELPFLRSAKGVVGAAFGRWTFSGLTVIESGFAYSPGLTISTPGLASRPNVVGSLSYPHTVNEWFNTSAFAAPAYGFFGDAGVGIIRGPIENVWNWALYKSFPITERANLQFRGEFFNVFNHPSFGNVDTNLGDADFGQITSALNPRIMEFGLRLSF
jgi:Carboxypeptidase regulatory-like domain